MWSSNYNWLYETRKCVITNKSYVYGSPSVKRISINTTVLCAAHVGTEIKRGAVAPSVGHIFQYTWYLNLQWSRGFYDDAFIYVCVLLYLLPSKPGRPPDTPDALSCSCQTPWKYPEERTHTHTRHWNTAVKTIHLKSTQKCCSFQVVEC